MTDLRSNNEFDSLESFFHERLKDASFAREDGLWKQIEEELERMEKEKRRRRFFWLWFSGVALLGGLAALWFFVLAENFQVNDVAKKQNVVAASGPKGPSSSTGTEIKAPANEKSLTQNINPENTPSDENPGEQNRKASSPFSKTDISTHEETQTISVTNKIQLAACKNKAKPAIFRDLPFAVSEVEGRDGFTRYFAETDANEEALQTVRSAGFASAFIKKNLDANTVFVTVKAGTNENKSIASNVPSSKSQQTTNPQTVSKSNASTSKAETKEAPSNNVSPNALANNSNNTLSKDHSTRTNEESANNTVQPSNSVKTENPPANENNANSNAVTPTSATTDTSKQMQTAQETKPDTAAAAVIAEVKKDSVPQKTELKDSAKTSTAEANPAPFSPEWAILLLAGPNIFTSQAQSNLYPTSGESQPISLNTELKLQFRPVKVLSFSGGVNYTTYSVKQDRTSFRFNKFQTDDYVFYSAFGPMAAPMSTLREGYSMLAPFDTFPCAYSQTSKLNMLNIPIEVNLHLLSRSRINIFVGLGANNSFALSQQSTLTLHKEHFDNTISYNKVTVSPFSLALLFSLGCDVRVGKKLYLTFVPSYRYGVTNLSTTNGTTFSPAYFSGNAGLKFKF